jgi:hypothetical protein
MAKVPASARAFAGRWRIVEMDVNADDSGFICERISFVQQPASTERRQLSAVTLALAVKTLVIRWPP